MERVKRVISPNADVALEVVSPTLEVARIAGRTTGFGMHAVVCPAGSCGTSEYSMAAAAVCLEPATESLPAVGRGVAGNTPAGDAVTSGVHPEDATCLDMERMKRVISPNADVAVVVHEDATCLQRVGCCIQRLARCECCKRLRIRRIMRRPHCDLEPSSPSVERHNAPWRGGAEIQFDGEQPICHRNVGQSQFVDPDAAGLDIKERKLKVDVAVERDPLRLELPLIRESRTHRLGRKR